MPLMKAIQVCAPGGDFKLVQKEIPEPKEHEVLLKVQACGVCHGDAIVKQGYFPGLQYPRTPGHEVVGTIAKLGSESHFWKVGQRVGCRLAWRTLSAMQVMPERGILGLRKPLGDGHLNRRRIRRVHGCPHGCAHRHSRRT